MITRAETAREFKAEGENFEFNIHETCLKSLNITLKTSRFSFEFYTF